MRYLGNKTKLLGFIEEVIEKYDIKGEIFADLFSGTAAVGDYFKEKYKVYANDFMYYSFVFCKAKLMNATLPTFNAFKKEFHQDPFSWLNSKKYTPSKHYFIYQNYTPVSERGFFIESNAIKIDGIRIEIEDLYHKSYISENEYFFLLASLLESVTKVSNTSGTYEAFFKFWENRANKPFVLMPLEMHCSAKVDSENKVFNEDANDLVRHISGDIAYIDTPYTITQYSSAYHVLETIARYDYPEIAGKSGRRQKSRKTSEYSRKQRAKESFEDLFRQIDFEHILVSYSTQSLVPIDELVELARSFAINREVFVETVPYREYKNLNSSQKDKELREVIIYFKKNQAFTKSPLNYSGSKDALLRNIFRELPKHVGTFIDAMGGAFNVGANVIALEKVVYNEYNPFIFPIVDMLITSEKQTLIKDIELIIKKFKLANSRKQEYLEFRNFYNQKEKTPLNLFVLHMFSFQNLIRFNNKFEFNTPVGNASYNPGLKQRIEMFQIKSPEVVLRQGTYEEIDFAAYEKGTVFYFDPPYLITTAEYNDGKRGFKGWDSDMEAKLLAWLLDIDRYGHYFMLSNVISHQGHTNNLLKEWIEYHNFKIVEIGKTGSRYPRKEILVKNF